MQKNKFVLLFFYLLFVIVLVVILTADLKQRARLEKLNDSTVVSDEFRAHELGEKNLVILKKLPANERGKAAALMLLEGYDNGEERLWTSRPAWRKYRDACQAIWNEAVYFPVPVSTTHSEYQVTFTDSWMNERSYGGKRGHEGTDLMASKDVPGLYPVVSISDG
ncbi:MAG: M23 family peptidase, partial [Bariatricus sp.]